MMNKKAAENILMENIMFLLVVLMFVSLTLGFLWARSNNGAIWEDFYSKEIARIVNSGQQGDVIRLDVQKATSIAKRNGLNIQEAGEMFLFNAKDKEICVTLTRSGGKCYAYFNNVAITEVGIELAVPVNVLNFKIVELTEGQNE